MFFVFLFILGTAVGSFLNVLIDRLPKGRSILGRSKCDFCKKQLQPQDLMPIVSFLMLKRRCRFCKKELSWQYPLVELTTGVLFVLTVQLPHDLSPVELFRTIIMLGIVSSLIVVFFADLKYQIIPDELQISFFIFALLLQVAAGSVWNTLPASLVDGLLVSAPILFLYLLTRGKGMGFGDVKLAFVMGFFLKLAGGFTALYLAFILGAAVGIFLLLWGGKKLKSKIAFGPFLVLGTLIQLLAVF